MARLHLREGDYVDMDCDGNAIRLRAVVIQDFNDDDYKKLASKLDGLRTEPGTECNDSRLGAQTSQTNDGQECAMNSNPVSTVVSKSSPRNGKEKAYAAIDAFLKHVDGESHLPPGLGLKNWHGDYWEIRSSIRDRILFDFTDRISFLFVGNHDEIKTFMKSRKPF